MKTEAQRMELSREGYLQEAIPVVRKFVRTFLDAECIVAPSSSCVSLLRDRYLKAAGAHDPGSLHVLLAD
jgi:hypothetical protein